MRRHAVGRLVFSLSATVYAPAEQCRCGRILATLGPINPYGRCKLMAEEILRDVVASDAGFRTMLLRYFNPVGAHKSGLIGEDPRGTLNNLMPFVAWWRWRAAASHLRQRLPDRGRDGVRDYISRGRLGAGARSGAREAHGRRGTARIDRQSRHRSRPFGARSRAELRNRKWQGHSFRDRGQTRGDSGICYADVTRAHVELRLAGPARSRVDVRRRLALAGGELDGFGA